MLETALKDAAAKAVGDLLGLASSPTTELLAASLREMLLRIDTVSTITGLSVPTVYRLMSQGNFPRPLKITGHARAWKLSEVMDWIDSRERDTANLHDAAQKRGESLRGSRTKV
ncbi:MAG TPA: AlpA family phage regulatory protein [Terriglobales bacterium]|nr:AlpA family phage regulatory protein [Terriglobales bacterium]